jgi:hypothetical protein
MPKRPINFMEKVLKTKTCWIWQRPPNSRGYGQIKINKIMHLVHRMSYETFRGIIPKGLQIDHLCRNKLCVNPNHLEVVTLKENVLRGIGITAVNSRKTHCKNGHKFSKENTYIFPNGSRRCRRCFRDSR